MSSKQVEKLVVLLKIWPQASAKNAEEYIQDTLETKMTRAAFQQARYKLGLATPDHTEDTIKKQAYARLVLAGIVANNGVQVNPDEARKEVRKQLKDKFGSDTNTVLLNEWIEVDLKELSERDYKTVTMEAKAKLHELGVQGKDDGRQTQLLY
jgi:hypothetical protein